MSKGANYHTGIPNKFLTVSYALSLCNSANLKHVIEVQTRTYVLATVINDVENGKSMRPLWDAERQSKWAERDTIVEKLCGDRKI